MYVKRITFHVLYNVLYVKPNAFHVLCNVLYVKPRILNIVLEFSDGATATTLKLRCDTLLAVGS